MVCIKIRLEHTCREQCQSCVKMPEHCPALLKYAINFYILIILKLENTAFWELFSFPKQILSQVDYHSLEWWQNKPVEERICKVCESGEVENEFHFIFSCTLYNNIRSTFLQNIGNIIPNIMELNEMSQIKAFMSKNFACLLIN